MYGACSLMCSDVDDTLREPDEDKVSSDGTKTEEDDQDDPPLVSSQDEAY